jgi:hypothetical protein
MSERIVHRADGSTVLLDESGNPGLGLVVTPEIRSLVLGAPTGEGRHPLDIAAVSLGRAQVLALYEVCGRWLQAHGGKP